MNAGASDSLQMSVWLRWYTVMLLGSARGVWWGLSNEASDWLAPGWPRAAGSLEMSDVILRRAARVVPWCSGVTGTSSGLVVDGETFATLWRHTYMGQVLGCQSSGKVCRCNCGKCACAAFLSSKCFQEDQRWLVHVLLLLALPPKSAERSSLSCMMSPTFNRTLTPSTKQRTTFCS